MRRVLVIGLLLLAGCGSSEKAETSFNESGDAKYTEQEVADLAGFTTDDGISWDGDGCQIAVIMTTEGAVKTYADAGDAVVTNPSGDVGVKFLPEPGCRESLQLSLKSVK